MQVQAADRPVAAPAISAAAPIIEIARLDKIFVTVRNDRIRALDVHTHVEVGLDGHDPMPPELRAAAERYFRGRVDRPNAEDVAAY